MRYSLHRLSGQEIKSKLELRVHKMQIERAQVDTQASSLKRGALPLLQLKGANQPSFLDRITYNLRERDARLKVSLHCTNHQPPVAGGLWMLSCCCH